MPKSLNEENPSVLSLLLFCDAKKYFLPLFYIRNKIPVFSFFRSKVEDKKQWTHPRTGKTKHLTGDLPFGWEKEVESKYFSLILSYL